MVERADARPWCVQLKTVGPVREDGADCYFTSTTVSTPVLDIKPYVPYADCRPEAVGGFAGEAPEGRLTVDIPSELLSRVPEERRKALLGVLAQDPRPPYQDDPDRVYGFGFAGLEVRFRVRDGVLTVVDVSTRSTTQ